MKKICRQERLKSANQAALKLLSKLECPAMAGPPGGSPSKIAGLMIRAYENHWVSLSKAEN